MAPTNREFEIHGVNHLALVCKDMARTVDFYTNVLGFPLIKTVEFPGGAGQHFFFDIGNGNSLAFFWFEQAPEAAPGIASPKHVVGLGPGPNGAGDFRTAHGSMNHVAFDVPAEKIDEYKRKLESKGVRVSEFLNHDDSVSGIAEKLHPGVFIRSIYFQDPDGVMLEFACWTRPLGEGDVTHRPKTAGDAK